MGDGEGVEFALDKKSGDQNSFSPATFDLDLVTALQFSQLKNEKMFFKTLIRFQALSPLPTGCVTSGNLYNIPELSFSSVKLR